MVLEWPSQSPIEILWHDLKQAVHARCGVAVAELKAGKFSPQRCERLIASNPKRLIAVFTAEVGATIV